MKINFSILAGFFFLHHTLLAQIQTEQLNLMPWPQKVEVAAGSFPLHKDLRLKIVGNDQAGRVHKAAVSFLRLMSNQTGLFLEHGFPTSAPTGVEAQVVVEFKESVPLSLNMDETYSLQISTDKVQIRAQTDIGALRALSTLFQLVSNDQNSYFLPNINIEDHPRFVWRGLMIDAARHFQPLEVIKRNLEAMAFVKLNVLHWHLVDDQGFRAEVKSHPKLTQLGSDGLYYTQEQIKEVVAYANDLGIRVVPEFDVPGHATSWLVAYPEIGSKPGATYEIERNSGIFDPTLDPTNPKTYALLADVIAEMAPLFPDTYFHIGGDENEGRHWDANPDIAKFKKKHKFKTNHELQNYFNVKILDLLKKQGKVMMGWEEILQPDLPKEVVVHSWKGEESLADALANGHLAVLSRGFYIDLVKPVEEHYLVEPLPHTAGGMKGEANLLGGEATMWSELVTPLTIDSRIWPRTAAIAERFWSDRKVRDIEHMKSRLREISFALERVGATHLRNKEVILRNLTNGADVAAVKDLTNICEPLIGYERNKGGAKYKTYSPFTLFADATTPNAVDAEVFNRSVERFLKDNNAQDLQQIKDLLTRWSSNFASFQKINNNPKLQVLMPLSKNLSGISEKLLDALENQHLDSLVITEMNQHKQVLGAIYGDTKVAVVASLEQLIDFVKHKYLKS